MEDSARVRSMQTMVDGLPLLSQVIDEDERVIVGGIEVEFVDPATVPIDSKAIPTTIDVMVKMVASQELEKAVAGRRDVFLYLFYKLRLNTYPLFAVRVEGQRMDPVVEKIRSPA